MYTLTDCNGMEIGGGTYSTLESAENRFFALATPDDFEVSIIDDYFNTVITKYYVSNPPTTDHITHLSQEKSGRLICTTYNLDCLSNYAVEKVITDGDSVETIFTNGISMLVTTNWDPWDDVSIEIEITDSSQ